MVDLPTTTCFTETLQYDATFAAKLLANGSLQMSLTFSSPDGAGKGRGSMTITLDAVEIPKLRTALATAAKPAPRKRARRV